MTPTGAPDPSAHAAPTITVAAIDDDRMLLTGLAAWLDPVVDITLTATAGNVAGFLDQHAAVEVVLLDLNLRDHTDPAANVRRLIAAGYRVLVVSTIPDPEYVLAAVEAGAAGYITKDNDLPALVDAIREVAAGDAAIGPDLAFLLSTDSRPSRPKLSPREQLVLTTYASGATLEATARRAGIAYGTAREYLQRIKRKYTAVGLPAATKVDLANRARELRPELDGLADRP